MQLRRPAAQVSTACHTTVFTCTLPFTPTPALRRRLRPRDQTMISRNDLAHLFRNPGPIVHPQHPPAQPPYNTNASMQASQRAEAERREKMRRIAKNPTDKNIPEGVEDVCIGDGVARYRELRDVERTLDATMMRKKLDVMDSKHHSRASRYGTMRIWISNTAENQPWQSSGIDADAFDFESENNATYRVKIQGRLLDEEGDDGLEDDEDDDDDKDADAMYVWSSLQPQLCARDFCASGVAHATHTCD